MAESKRRRYQHPQQMQHNQHQKSPFVSPNSKVTLKLPTTSKWDSWPVSGKKEIYVRQCYKKALQHCHTAWNSEPTFQIVFIKGTPGVGKSYFLDYALACMIEENHKVLLISGPNAKAMLFESHQTPPQVTDVMTGLKETWADKADYVLIDPPENASKSQEYHQSFLCGKNTAVAVSPDPENLKKLEKDDESAVRIYLGPCSSDEARDMWQLCYSTQVSNADFERRFAASGGIPRYLFKRKSPLTLEDSVLQAVAEHQTFALNDLANNPARIDGGNVASEFKSLWSLYHLVPDENLTSYTIQLCCENAKYLLRARLLNLEVAVLWTLFDQTNENQGALRGIRFEAYVHKKILVQGLNVTAQRLNTSGISKTTTRNLVIPAGSKQVVLPDNDVNKLQDKRAEATPLIQAALGSTFVIITPEENIVTTKLAGGPATLDQFVAIVKEDWVL